MLPKTVLLKVQKEVNELFYLKTSITIRRYNIKVKRYIFISRILRNTFPVKFYYHFSLINWTAATECASSSEHAHCAWYEMLIMGSMHASMYVYRYVRTRRYEYMECCMYECIHVSNMYLCICVCVLIGATTCQMIRH